MMVYEWATGDTDQGPDDRHHAAAGRPAELADRPAQDQHRCCAWYFGKPYMTYICGRKVPEVLPRAARATTSGGTGR